MDKVTKSQRHPLFIKYTRDWLHEVTGYSKAYLCSVATGKIPLSRPFIERVCFNLRRPQAELFLPDSPRPESQHLAPQTARNATHRKFPRVPDVFEDGLGVIPTDRSSWGIHKAIQDAVSGRGWDDNEGNTVPIHRIPTNRGTGFISVSVRESNGEIAVAPDLLTALWQKVNALDDLTSDVLLVCLAHWVARSEGSGVPVQVTADAILDARGIQRKRNPRESGNWKHGHRQEGRMAVGRALAQLDSLWLEIKDVTVIPAGKHRKSRRLKVESRALAILDKVTEQDSNGNLVFLAARVMPGKWAEAYWELGLRQTGLLAQKALEYDPYHQQLEKRLTKYLAFQYRINASRSSGTKDLKVKTLLENISIEPNQERPQRIRDRLERALDCLKADGVVADWDYSRGRQDFEDNLPPKTWLRVWLETTISITLPEEIQAHYGISQRSRALTAG